MPSDDPTGSFTPSQPAEGSVGDASTHTQATTHDRPGTQDALRGQGNSAARTDIPRDDVAPALRAKKDGESTTMSGDSSLNREDNGPVVRQELNNKDKEIPNYVTTGKDERESLPEPGRLQEPKKDNDSNLVEAGTTMSGDASAYGGLDEKHKQQQQKNKKSKL